MGDIKRNLLAELLNNIKILKLYGWVDEFKKRVKTARDNEMVAFQKQLYHNAWTTAFNHMVP